MPKAGSFTDRPSTTNWFSGEVVPLMDTPYGVRVARPGASSARDSKERAAPPLPPGRFTTAMLRTKSAPTFTPVVVEPTSMVGGGADDDDLLAGCPRAAAPR